MVAPDDTPTRLQRIAENLATDYYIGTFKHTDDIHFLLAEVSRLQQENATVYTFLSRIIDVVAPSNPAAGGKTMTLCQQVDHYIVELREENALLRRSLDMLTKQLNEKDSEIVELKDAVYRLCPPRS